MCTLFADEWNISALSEEQHSFRFSENNHTSDLISFQRGQVCFTTKSKNTCLYDFSLCPLVILNLSVFNVFMLTSDESIILNSTWMWRLVLFSQFHLSCSFLKKFHSVPLFLHSLIRIGDGKTFFSSLSSQSLWTDLWFLNWECVVLLDPNKVIESRMVILRHLKNLIPLLECVKLRYFRFAKFH